MFLSAEMSLKMTHSRDFLASSYALFVYTWVGLAIILLQRFCIYSESQ